MTLLNVLCVFGTRPDAIKMAPVVLELKRRSQQFNVRVAVTGQHREMLDQVLSVFQIKPDFDLNIMSHGATLTEITNRALQGLEPILRDNAFDWVLAQGDTTTTFAAGLAAFYQKIAFGHVEAGLRTGNKYDPFPEEMNRLLVSRLAELHFAPTQDAVDNLLNEGIPRAGIYRTGNTGIDALLEVAKRPYTADNAELSDVLNDPRRMILVTTHRRENWGAPMARIATAIKLIVQMHPDVVAVVPMHRNPLVRESLIPILGNHPSIKLIEPPDYVPFVKLQQKATLILTDSGGVQEEAPSLGKPVLVLRETTERPEGIAAGAARLVGTDIERIVDEANVLLEEGAEYEAMARTQSPYGDGSASAQIAEALVEAATPRETTHQ